MSGIGADKDDQWLRRTLRDLQRQIDEVRRARSLENASISNGGLTVKGGGGIRLKAPDGTPIFVMHSNPDNPRPDGTPQPEVIIRRDDGTAALAMHDPLPNQDGYNQALRWFDPTGNEIVADDMTSRTGLALPWMPAPLYPARYTDWPGTDSGTFETLWQGFIPKINPKLRLYFTHTSDVAGTTGEVRVTVNGTQIGSTAAVGFVIASAQLDETTSAAIHDVLDVQIQARRTAGTGLIRVSPFQSYGRQS